MSVYRKENSWRKFRRHREKERHGDVAQILYTSKQYRNY